jgi:hypothetical protein
LGFSPNIKIGLKRVSEEVSEEFSEEFSKRNQPYEDDIEKIVSDSYEMKTEHFIIPIPKLDMSKFGYLMPVTTSDGIKLIGSHTDMGLQIYESYF